jgi:hypothetical protein
MMTELILAMLIATALLMSLVIAIGKLHGAELQLADSRAAARRLESALVALQSGGAADPDLQIERLPGAVAGHAWVRLSLPPRAPGSAPGNTPPRASLVGLIPADKAPGGAP